MQITIDIGTILIALAALAVVLHTISVEMRLADLTRRLESDERSTERLSQVWWEGASQRYATQDRSDERALISLTDHKPS